MKRGNKRGCLFERHCENKVSYPRTQHYVPLAPDGLIRRQAH